MKLCQVTALLTGRKGPAMKQITEVLHTLKKSALFVGLTKRYAPKEEEGERYPDEVQRVQQTVAGCMATVRSAMTSLMDLTATQDAGNCGAAADVKIDGVVLLPVVPVTHLLWLEKHLVDLRTIAESIPVLDPAEKWVYSAESGCYVSEPSQSLRTRKLQKVLVMYQATPEHPAQTQLITEDAVVGTVQTLKFSSAMPADERAAILVRINQVVEAVKLAREEANSGPVKDVRFGDQIFNFVFQAK